jgi:class 3 adenylate cyclase
MKSLQSLPDGQLVDVLVAMTDISGFTQIARSRDLAGSYSLLRKLSTMTAEILEPAGGLIVKYMGDASLIVFPDDKIDSGVAALLRLKEAIEGYFVSEGLSNKLTTSIHFGEVIVGRLPPLKSLDIFGHTVNIAWTLDRGFRGKFIATPQVFRKLKPAMRKRFHKHTPPVVYLAE